MMKLSPEQFSCIFQSPTSIIGIVERIIVIEGKLKSSSWYAIKASGNTVIERDNLLHKFEIIRKVFNDAALSELENELILLEDKLDRIKVNSFIKAIGRQFMMAEKRDLLGVVKLKKVMNELPPINDLKDFLKNHT